MSGDIEKEGLPINRSVHTTGPIVEYICFMVQEGNMCPRMDDQSLSAYRRANCRMYLFLDAGS